MINGVQIAYGLFYSLFIKCTTCEAEPHDIDVSYMREKQNPVFTRTLLMMMARLGANDMILTIVVLTFPHSQAASQPTLTYINMYHRNFPKSFNEPCARVRLPDVHKSMRTIFQQFFLSMPMPANCSHARNQKQLQFGVFSPSLTPSLKRTEKREWNLVFQ